MSEKNEEARLSVSEAWSRRKFLSAAAGGITAAAALGMTSDAFASQSTTNSPVAKAFERLAKLSGSERQRVLEQEAAKEGKVVMYSADDPVLLRKWNAAFDKQYPKVSAQFVRMSVPQVLQKAVAEASTGHPVADFLHVNAPSLAILKQKDLLIPYASPEVASFNPRFRDPKNIYSIEWIDQYIVGYNTQMVKESEVPRTLEELADPRWKGKLATPSVGGPSLVAGVFNIYGKQKGMELLKKIGRQDVRLYGSNTALGNALTAGQVPIAFTFLLEIAAKLKDEGAPVGWVVANPTILLPYFQVMMKDAPHPYAAALAYDWILSARGQDFVKMDRIMGARKDTKYPKAQLTALRTAEQQHNKIITLTPDLLANPKPFEKTFKDIFVQG